METSPTKLTLETFGKKFEYTGHWDITFTELLDVFLGLCSAAGFSDKTKLYEIIYEDIKENELIELKDDLE